VQAYRNIVRGLARPEVDTFLTLPGLGSLYFWAQKDPPTGYNVPGWMTLFDDPCQEQIWAAANRHPGLMVVRCARAADFWARGQPIGQRPLVRHIEENFRTASVEAFTTGSEASGSRYEYELMVRR
jgi:hypothetical protein